MNVEIKGCIVEGMGIISGLNTIIDTLLSYRADYTLVTEEYFKHWSFKTGILCGLIFILIFIPIYLYAHAAVAKRFQKRHPNEKIIYVIKNSLLFAFFITYCYGAFLGYYFLPFICFKNTSNLSFPYNTGPWILIFAYLISFIFIFIALNVTYVISDKRIEVVSAYKIFDKILKKHCFFFQDMANISLEKYLFISQLDIKFKDGEHFYLTRGFVNFEEVRRIVKERINEFKSN